MFSPFSLFDWLARRIVEGLFGFKVTALYIGFGVTLELVTGYAAGLLRLEKWVEPFVWEVRGFGSAAHMDDRRVTMRDRFAEGGRSSRTIFVKVWPYIVGGIGVGSLIHGYVPEQFIVRWAGPENWFAVPLAVAIGVPLYANVAGVLPITEALVNKGLPLGTVLSFTMAVTALSLPEMIILRKALRPPLLAVFVALLTAGMIGVGYLFNALLR
ncbi:MAG: permease [Bryobacteraceae bacterium]